MSEHDEPSPEDIDRVSAALRASAPTTGEPDWAQLSASIGAAVDGEARRQRRTRVVLLGGAVIAAAAVAALLVWPGASRPARMTTAAAPVDAATPAQDGGRGAAREAEIAAIEAELGREGGDLVEDDVAVPDDLGGLTVDEELIDEAAAAFVDVPRDDDAIDAPLLPDGAWIDELSDDELERAVAILDGEAG
ncbi:MAG TPA: hypothetical protein VM261_11165 [Kofleriaceae bacterium]|nr:hypothetical protein [Kofleriaceae bacterium]